MRLVLGALAFAVRWALADAEPGICDGGISGAPECQQGSHNETGDGQPGRPLEMASLIAQEVGELHSFVKLCEDRISLLRQLKGAVTAGHNVSLPDSHIRALTEKLPLLAEVVDEDDRVPTGSADDYLIAKRVIPQASPQAFVRFLQLRSPRTSSPSSTAQTAMPSALIVAVQRSGQANLFSPTGELVHSYETLHKHPITHLAVSPSHDEYFIATADDHSVIKVHKVNTRQRRLTKEQKQARRTSKDEKISQYLGSQVNVTTQFQKAFRAPLIQNKTTLVTALAVVSQQGTKYFVTGDVDGKVNIFTRNGTFHAKLNATTTPTPIEGLHVHLSNVVFRSQDSWGFINLEKLEVTHVHCDRFNRHVVDAIVDTQQSSRVVVADDEGTVWVLSVKDKRHCKVEHRFPHGATRGSLTLASIRGFTIGLERRAHEDAGAEEPQYSSSVVALNMSHVGKKKADLISSPSPVIWRESLQPVRDWSVHKRYQQGDLLAFLSEDGLEVEIVELLMQVYTMKENVAESFNNYKFPVIAVAIVLVLGYLFLKSKGAFGSKKKKGDDFGDFGSPKGGGRGKKPALGGYKKDGGRSPFA